MKKKRDRKNCAVHLRMPCWLKKQLRKEAATYGTSLSDWIVKLLLESG